MKKILVLSLAITANLNSFAQSDVDIGDKFSLSGESIMFFKTEKADKNVRPSSKIWHLEGNVVNGSKKVLFWLSDPNTEENTDSAEWAGSAQVVMRLKESGAKAYIVQDDDSTYLSIISIQDDVYGVQMYASARKGAIVTKTGWKITKMEADELKGTKGGNVCMYTETGIGSIIVWDWNDPQFRLVSHDGIFNINAGGWLEILVGFYKDDGTLIDKMSLWLSSEDGSSYNYARTISKGMIPPGQKKKVNKIFKALQSDNGYVRIVAPRYNVVDFDIKIPSVKQE